MEATITLNNVSGRLEGDTAIVTVTYNGKYYRQGWDIPCQKISPMFNGLEEKNLSGTYTFSVTGKPSKGLLLLGNKVPILGKLLNQGMTPISLLYALYTTLLPVLFETKPIRENAMFSSKNIIGRKMSRFYLNL